MPIRTATIIKRSDVMAMVVTTVTVHITAIADTMVTVHITAITDTMVTVRITAMVVDTIARINVGTATAVAVTTIKAKNIKQLTE